MSRTKKEKLELELKEKGEDCHYRLINGIMVFNQEEKRKKSEMETFLDKLKFIEETGQYPMPNKGFGELKSEEKGLINSDYEWIDHYELTSHTLESVQILPVDKNTPFSDERYLIINAIRLHNTRLTALTKRAWGNVSEQKIEEMRRANLVHLFQVVDAVATNAFNNNQNFLLTYGSGDGGLTSISETLHLQFFPSIIEGIELDNNYDHSQLANIKDLPIIIKRANQQGLTLNMRFLGNSQVLIHGVYINGYRSGSENKQPNQLDGFSEGLDYLKYLKKHSTDGVIPDSVIKKNKLGNLVTLLRTLALTPGSVEAFAGNIVTDKSELLLYLQQEYGIRVLEFGEILGFYGDNSRQIDARYLKA